MPLLRTDLELYVSANNGEVICGDHTWPSDIHRWSRMNVEEASEWVSLVGGNGCEMCSYGASFIDKGWRP